MILLVGTPSNSFYVEVFHDVDTTTRFQGRCLYTGDLLEINGWMCDIEQITQAQYEEDTYDGYPYEEDTYDCYPS